MSSSGESLVHEATSLLRLVVSIDRFVSEHEDQFAYTEAAQAFLKDTHKWATEDTGRIADITSKAAKAPDQVESRYLPELITLKGRWKTLHTYIKPAIDAHTLTLPAPLIKMATEHLKQIHALAESSIVALLTPELMYFYNTPKSAFSSSVLVEVPYSQAPGFFTNLTIYHEIGHYVYERLGQVTSAAGKPQASTNLTEAMERAFAEKLRPALPTARNRAWAERVLAAWTREIFCDLFALRNLGPAFSFALIDMLSLIGLMTEETEIAFDEEHPAPAVRFREQLRVLKSDGWWTTVQDLQTEHISLISRLAGQDRDNYFFEFQEKRIPEFTTAFENVVPLIHEAVVAITGHCVNLAQDFAQNRGEIEQCLAHGVVPSRLLVDDNPSWPTPIAMVNAAYCFYLSRLPELMDKLEDQDSSKPADRQKWIQKLESWTMKGIEDYYLLKAEQKARVAITAP